MWASFIAAGWWRKARWKSCAREWKPRRQVCRLQPASMAPWLHPAKSLRWNKFFSAPWADQGPATRNCHGWVKHAGLNMAGLNMAPTPARQQMAAVAELRWRIFVNSLRTVRGRLELASRIFIGLAFVVGGIGGAVGLGGAAWFLLSQGNPEWLGVLLWPVFLFWQLFPLMATAFTENVDSSTLLRFPLSYPSYLLIRLAYGSLDPATTVASLWLLGITIGIGAARPRLLPWAAVVLVTFAMVNILLARM